MGSLNRKPVHAEVSRNCFSQPLERTRGRYRVIAGRSALKISAGRAASPAKPQHPAVPMPAEPCEFSFDAGLRLLLHVDAHAISLPVSRGIAGRCPPYPHQRRTDGVSAGAVCPGRLAGDSGPVGQPAQPAPHRPAPFQKAAHTGRIQPVVATPSTRRCLWGDPQDG